MEGAATAGALPTVSNFGGNLSALAELVLLQQTLAKTSDAKNDRYKWERESFITDKGIVKNF